MPKDYYIYMLECGSGRLYTGYAVDLEKRFSEHLSGKRGAKFTRAFKPRRIAASWKVYGDRGDALRIESFIKSMARKEKILIKESPGLLIERLKSIEDIKFDITVFENNASKNKD